MTTLVPATDAHFAWMLGDVSAAAPPGLVLPEGGIDDAAVLAMLRQLAADIRALTGDSAWLIVAGGEAVGLISFVKPPDAGGAVEIGYGVAASRRGRGHATHAVTALVNLLRQQTSIQAVTAGTAIGNHASRRALERTGFAEFGTRFDETDGDVTMWRLALDDSNGLRGPVQG